VNAFFPQSFQQGGGKFALGQRFSPGKGNAASRFLVERPVLKANFYSFLKGIEPGIGGVPLPQKARFAPLGFGIGTPFAGKGASLEKHHGSDAGAVVEAEFLNVKEKSGSHSSSVHFSCSYVKSIVYQNNFFCDFDKKCLTQGKNPYIIDEAFLGYPKAYSVPGGNV
jgi:hypothetical protein